MDISINIKLNAINFDSNSFPQDNLGDIIIIFENNIFTLQKQILAQNSSYFAQLASLKNIDQIVLKNNEYSLSTFTQVMKILYGSNETFSLLNDFDQLIEIVNFIQSKSIKDQIIEKLKKVLKQDLNKKLLLKLFSLSSKYQFDQIQAMILDQFKKLKFIEKFFDQSLVDIKENIQLISPQNLVPILANCYLSILQSKENCIQNEEEYQQQSFEIIKEYCIRQNIYNNEFNILKEKFLQQIEQIRGQKQEEEKDIVNILQQEINELKKQLKNNENQYQTKIEILSQKVQSLSNALLEIAQYVDYPIESIAQKLFKGNNYKKRGTQQQNTQNQHQKQSQNQQIQKFQSFPPGLTQIQQLNQTIIPQQNQELKKFYNKNKAIQQNQYLHQQEQNQKEQENHKNQNKSFQQHPHKQKSKKQKARQLSESNQQCKKIQKFKSELSKLKISIEFHNILINQISQHLNEQQNQLEFKLLYAGYSNLKLHQLYENLEQEFHLAQVTSEQNQSIDQNLLIVIQIKEQSPQTLIGAFTRLNLQNNNKWLQDDKSFLFKINSQCCVFFKQSKPNSQILFSSNNQINFGNDLIIQDQGHKILNSLQQFPIQFQDTFLYENNAITKLNEYNQKMPLYFQNTFYINNIYVYTCQNQKTAEMITQYAEQQLQQRQQKQSL